MNEKKNWLLCMIAHEISDNHEDYENVKKYLDEYFKDDCITIIENYYLNKIWKQALKIEYNMDKEEKGKV